MKFLVSIVFACCLALSMSYCQVLYPTSHNGGEIRGGVCLGCAVQNPDLAIDSDNSTYQKYELTAAALNVTGSTSFDFGQVLSSQSLINLEMSFPDLVSGTFGSLLCENVLDHTRIKLLDEFDAVIFEYNSSNRPTVELINDAENRVKIKIINAYQNVRKIEFESGSLVSLVGDVLLYDVKAEFRDMNFVSRSIASGYYDGSSIITLSTGHNIVNQDYATYNSSASFYDVNSEFASMEHTLNINLGSDYLFARYDWMGTAFSGSAFDLFLQLENANVLAVSDIKLLFDSGLIDIEVQYSDLSTQLFSSSSPLVQCETQALGSKRFFIKVDLQDGKNIISAEIRFKPFVNLASALRVYSVFLADNQLSNPLPVELISVNVEFEDDKANLLWYTRSEINSSHFVVTHLNNNLEKVGESRLEAAGNSDAINYYSSSLNLLEEESYLALTLTDLDGTIHNHGIYALKALENEISIYPNPSNGQFTLADKYDNAEYSLYDMNGKFVKNVRSGVNEIDQRGCYILISDKVNKKIIIEP